MIKREVAKSAPSFIRPLPKRKSGTKKRGVLVREKGESINITKKKDELIQIRLKRLPCAITRTLNLIVKFLDSPQGKETKEGAAWTSDIGFWKWGGIVGRVAHSFLIGFGNRITWFVALAKSCFLFL